MMMLRKVAVLAAVLVGVLSILFLANVHTDLPQTLDDIFGVKELDWARRLYTDIFGEASAQFVSLMYILSVGAIALATGVYLTMQGRIDRLEDELQQGRVQATREVGHEQTAIKVQALKRIYKMGDVEVPALRGLDLEIRPGEYVAIFGPSGSGKSTLLNLMGALDRPTEGTVFIDGVDISTLDDSQRAEIRRRKVGFVFQFFALMPRMTALQNVELSLTISEVDGSERRKRAKELLGMVGLRDRAGHRPSELSGGEQQRVAIARALANDPTFVLLDEPTGNLDQETGRGIADLLNMLNEEQGKTFVVVTHDPMMAEEADRILQMADGQIVKEVTKAEGL